MPALTVLFAVVALVGLLSAVALGYAVYRDASARSATAARELGVAAAVLAMPVVPLYLLYRGRLGARGPPTVTERRARTVALGGLLTFAVAAVASPPDPASQLLAAVVAYLPLLAVAYLLVGR